MELPLSRLQRPQWDVITLLELGVKGVEVEAQEWIVSAPEKGKKCIASFLLCITCLLYTSGTERRMSVGGVPCFIKVKSSNTFGSSLILAAE